MRPLSIQELTQRLIALSDNIGAGGNAFGWQGLPGRVIDDGEIGEEGEVVVETQFFLTGTGEDEDVLSGGVAG